METLESALPLDKTDHTKRDIALLHLRYGDEEVGYRQFMQLQGGADMDADSVLSMADSMIARSGWERAIQLLEQHSERFPDDYRIAYLRAVALEESGEEEKAIQAFLHLLDFDKEIAKLSPQAQARLYSRYAAAGQTNAESIKGLNDLYQIQGAYWTAYQYRQQLQSGRIRFQSNFGNQKTGLITLPTSLSNLGTQALAHLRQLSQLFYSDDDPIDKNVIAIGLKQRDFKNVALLLAIPLNNPFSQGAQIDISLLDRFPDSDALHAMAITTQMNQMVNRQGQVDLELLTRCYNKLHDQYPVLSLNAATVASASGEKEAFAMLRQSLAENPKSDGWAGLAPHSISYLLFNHADENFPEDLKKVLMGKLRESRATQVEASNKTQGINPLLRFNPNDPYIGILRKQKGLSDFVAYLDQQCSDYEKALDDPQLKNNITSLGGLGQYLRYYYSSQPIFRSLSFPPPETPDIAPNMLTVFVQTPGYNFSGKQAPIDPQEAKRVAQKANDPFLKLFLLDLAEDTEAAQKQIEAILAAAKKKHTRLPLRESLIAAAWYQKNEQWEKSAQILEAVRLTPMDATLRRRIDALLVICAKEAKLDEKSFQAADAKGLAKQGPAAALRLRYGTLSPQHRAELISVLDEFGFKTEAKQLEAKKIAQNNRASSMMPTASVGAQGVREKIEKMIKDGKKEQAEKLLSRTIEQNVRTLTSNGNVRWDYNLLNLLNSIRRTQAKMLEKIYQQAVPGKNATSADHLRYAAMLEMNVKFKEAAKSYDAALVSMSKSSQKKFLPRIALIKGMDDPEAGAKLMQQLDQTQLSQFGQLMQTVMQPIDYSGDSTGLRFDVRLKHAQMISEWLNSIVGDKKLARTDLSWVLQYGLHNISSSMYPLPDIAQYDRYSLKSALSDKNKKLVEPRQKAFADLCLAMSKHPLLARKAFSALSRQRIANDAATAFNEGELLALAGQITSNSKPSNNPMARFNSVAWISLTDDHHPLWTPEEFLIQHSLLSKEGADDIQQTVELVSKSKDRNGAKIARAFAQMKTGTAEEFESAIQAYLNASSGNMGMQNNYFSSSTSDVIYSAANKVFVTWQARQGEISKVFSMEEFLLKAIKKSRQTFRNDTLLLAADYTQWLAQKQGWQAAQNWLLKVTESWLGDRKRWAKFKKEARRKIANANGSYYYQGGQFTDITHKQYAGFLQRCGADPSLVFNLVAFAEKNGLDHQKQISQQTVLSQLSSSNVTRNSKLITSIIKNSPFIGASADFRSGDLQQNRDPLFKTFLDASRRWKKEEQTPFKKFLSEKNTFSSQLALAYLQQKDGGDKNTDAVAKFLGTQRAVIEKMPEINKNDLATLVVKFYPKGVPVDGLDKDALAVVDQLGTARTKSAKETAEDFLQVAKLSELNITDSRKLREKIAPMLNPLLQSDQWDLMEKVIWHAIKLGKIEQKKGNWNTSQHIPWTLSSSIAYDLLRLTAGGGLERIAFYQRLVENDKEGQIGVIYDNSKFSSVLKAAFNQAGGSEQMEKALSKVTADLWKLTKSQQDLTLAGLIWTPLIYHFPPDQMPRAIAWADKHAEGESWSPLAKEIAMCWRLIINITTQRVTQPYWDKVPNLEAWQDHYLAVIDNESLSITYRMNVAHILSGGKTGMLKDRTIRRSTELLIESMLGEHPNMGWSFTFITREFCLLPKNEEWTTLAEKLCEAWTFASRHNTKDHKFGQAWHPSTVLVLQSLQLHCRLGDKEKLNQFRKEKTASERLLSTARTVFCLVQYGFFDEALEELKRDTNFQDISTDYVATNGYYQAYYDSRVHTNLPKFLAKIDEPGLRFYAETLILGSFDLPKGKEEKNATYKRRPLRITDAVNRFSKIDFEGDEILKGHTLRLFDIYDYTSFHLKSELAAHFAKADFKNILNSKNYRRIEYDIRVLGSHANNQLREQDLIPVRKFLQFLRKTKTEEYYQRKALQHFSLRIASSMPARSHFAMSPSDLQSHADALHLLLAIPDHKLMTHSGLQTTAISKVAADVLLGQFPEVKSQLETNRFNQSRINLLGKGLYKNIYTFWRPMTVVMKFKSSDLNYKPDTKERHRRVEALLAHPIIIEGLKNERNLEKILTNNAWVSAEEFNTDWGRKLMKDWQTAHTPKAKP